MQLQLNEKQKQMVDAKEGPVLVVACPGSGKTTTMIARAKALVDYGVNPAKLLVITFTKQAATHMQQKYEKAYGKEGITFGTIHSICYRMLQSVAGYTKKDILLESEKWAFLAGQLHGKVAAAEMEETISGIMREISFVKNKCIPPEAYEPDSTDKRTFCILFHAYEDFRKSAGKIDFDDMLILARDILFNNGMVLDEYRKKYSYIMIDEFQDTNRVQADIFYLLAGKNGNILVVGDDDQNVYGFRAAESAIMLDFPKKFPNCKIIYLDTNYRSEPEIIEIASKLIACNKKRFEKDFKGEKKGKGHIKITCFPDVVKQRDSVVEQLKKLHETGVPYEEMSVLYRTNKQNLMYVQALMKEEIPFYTTEAVKDHHMEFPFQDFMAYYRLAAGNPWKGDLQRILNRPSRYLKGDAFKNCIYNIDQMIECANRCSNPDAAKDRIYSMVDDIENLATMNPTQFVGYLYNVMDYRAGALSYAAYCGKDESEVNELLDSLIDEAKQFNTMQEWADYAKTYNKKLQEKRKNKEGICFSTYHSAKGLEWDYVFLIDCNEDMTPFKKAESPEEIEEERRLFYVAVTRARKGVRFTWVSDNGPKKMFPSRFLTEMGINKDAAVSNKNGRSMSSKKAKVLPSAKFYAVKKGRKPGIYHTWHECQKQIDDFPGAVYRRFDTEAEAKEFI